MTSVAAFDRLAARYDELWTNTSTGRAQREAVWRHLDPLFSAGSSVVDLGCGTGEDALHFGSAGVTVSAFDVSPEMVRIACARGVRASVLALEDTRHIEGVFDGVISNFGALNCVSDLAALRPSLARLVRPGGHLAICTIGRFCLRETVHFLPRGRLRHAARRWSGRVHSESLNIRIAYPTVLQIRRAFAPEFRLIRTAGIGLAVPPSYIRSGNGIARQAAIDRRLAHVPFFRALTDHRLLVFVRT